MTEEKEIRNRIITMAQELFVQYGFSKSTMEEIAGQLSISKKTLYKHFRNKEEILREGFKLMKCDIEGHIDSIINNTEMDFMEKLSKIMLFVADKVNQFKGHFMTDLQRNHPEIYSEIQEFRRKNTYAKMSLLINEGVEKGVFRGDVDKNLLVIMYTSAINAVINPDVLSKLPLSGEAAYRSIISVLFEGMLTEQGREFFDNENFNRKEELANEIIL
ncbi:MAG: TetR/AcrR family transcriptional regulator [Ignavibacteriaceae bacterium]|nr:TetR/AcrR family transcriptional regulator [Ignavibacteriaceae bacterium]